MADKLAGKSAEPGKTGSGRRGARDLPGAVAEARGGKTERMAHGKMHRTVPVRAPGKTDGQAEPQAASLAAVPVLDNGVFPLANWLPYDFSLVSSRVSTMLGRMVSERFNLPLNAWRVLAVLADAAPLSAKQVAEGTGMNAVNVSRALTQLDQLGMIRRSTNTADFRQVMLAPSKKGQAAYLAVLPLAEAIEDELMAGMKSADVAALRRAVGALADSARARLPETRDWRTLLPPPKSGRAWARNPGVAKRGA